MLAALVVSHLPLMESTVEAASSVHWAVVHHVVVDIGRPFLASMPLDFAPLCIHVAFCQKRRMLKPSKAAQVYTNYISRPRRASVIGRRIPRLIRCLRSRQDAIILAELLDRRGAPLIVADCSVSLFCARTLGRM